MQSKTRQLIEAMKERQAFQKELKQHIYTFDDLPVKGDTITITKPARYREKNERKADVKASQQLQKEMNSQLYTFTDTAIYVSTLPQKCHFYAPDDPSSWDAVEKLSAPRQVIICAASDVDEMRRHYGHGYEVLPA